jgi:hypothetical protein
VPKYQVKQGEKLPPKRTGSLLNDVTNAVNQLTIAAPSAPLMPPGSAPAAGPVSRTPAPSMRPGPTTVRPKGPLPAPGPAGKPAAKPMARQQFPKQKPSDVASARAMMQPRPMPGTAPATPEPATQQPGTAPALGAQNVQPGQASVINIYTAPGAQK